MELTLILLTGTLTGAFLVASFYLGMRYEQSRPKPENDSLVVTDRNKEAVREMMEWMNYGGKR